MKTETKHTHTQGPWKAYFYAKDSCGRIVATVGANDGCNRICEITPIALPENEVKANARLITAAPDLLAALQEIESKLTTLLFERRLDSTDSAFYQVRHVRNLAETAIAKAEGKA